MNQKIEKEIQRTILLNPGPATTSERVKQAQIVSDICPREKEFGALMAGVRKKVLAVVNADENYESVLIGGSGTGAIESCLSSCVSSAHGILIIENGAYGARMEGICNALGIKSKVLKLGWGTPVNLEDVEEFIRSNQHEFRVLAFVHHETTTGILNPLSEIHQLSKKYNLITLVDAMSSYAGLPIDLSVDDVDYLVSSSNKCIQGMAGIGIVVVKAKELEQIASFDKRSFYFDLYKNFYSQKEKGQFLFTPPVQTLYALNEALDEFYEQGGINARFQKHKNLYELMFNGMKELGFKPLLEDKDNSMILTTFFEPKSEKYSFNNMHDFLFEKGFTIYPGKVDDKDTFRISNIGELTREDISSFLESMKSYLTHSEIGI